MRQRLDLLAGLGTTIITISGGEPLLHPDLDEIVAHIRRRHAIAGMITNGYLLTAERIKRLNRAGLDHLQISIDNVMPDDVSKKSLKVLDKKLQLLAEHADFHVNINSVVGGGIRNPQDALVVGKRAVELGFTSTVGIIHDGDGQLQPLADAEQRSLSRPCAPWERAATRASTISRTTSRTARRTSGAAGPARAISTSAKTAWCTTARSSADIRPSRWPNTPSPTSAREFLTEKCCAPRCTVACVHQISYIDFWRGPQTNAPRRPPATRRSFRLGRSEVRNSTSSSGVALGIPK